MFEEPGMGAVLTYTQPLFVFCLALLFLKEEVKTIRLSGLVIGFIGVAVLFLREYSSAVRSPSNRPIRGMSDHLLEVPLGKTDRNGGMQI